MASNKPRPAASSANMFTEFSNHLTWVPGISDGKCDRREPRLIGHPTISSPLIGFNIGSIMIGWRQCLQGSKDSITCYNNNSGHWSQSVSRSRDHSGPMRGQCPGHVITPTNQKPLVLGSGSNKYQNQRVLGKDMAGPSSRVVLYNCKSCSSPLWK